MKHSGKALKAGIKLIFWTLVLAAAIVAAAFVAEAAARIIKTGWEVIAAAWVLFTAFTIYFFRDPEPNVPNVRGAILSPAHGKVDVIDECEEPEFMGGRCQRISIFLSVFDVHIQNAPVNGSVAYMRYTPGQFLSATKSDCAGFNENSFVGFDVVDFPGQKIAVRQIAGLIARRIITWVEMGEKVPRSQRIGLIQFGSRVELYLPLGVKIHTRLGERVKGGETILASFDEAEPVAKPSVRVRATRSHGG
jgi:phosphatidylserine decarboxylase